MYKCDINKDLHDDDMWTDSTKNVKDKIFTTKLYFRDTCNKALVMNKPLKGRWDNYSCSMCHLEMGEEIL